jgi:flavorubredoxin
LPEQARIRPASVPSGAFPRKVSETLLWSGGCLDFDYKGSKAHSHFSVFLQKGSRRSVLVDSGHPIHFPDLERHVAEFLDGRPLDYLFITHGEFPHGGALPHWLRRYPDLVVVAPMVDYGLYYPEFAERIRTVRAGDALDLGDRQFVFLPAIWRDLPYSLWAFETLERTLFVADAFAFLHYHHDGECDRLDLELPEPDLAMMQFFNERAMQWTRFTDASETFPDVEEIVRRARPRLIAPAHGNLVTDIDDMLAMAKRSMMVGPRKAVQAGHGVPA